MVDSWYSKNCPRTNLMGSETFSNGEGRESKEVNGRACTPQNKTRFANSTVTEQHQLELKCFRVGSHERKCQRMGAKVLVIEQSLQKFMIERPLVLRFPCLVRCRMNAFTDTHVRLQQRRINSARCANRAMAPRLQAARMACPRQHHPQAATVAAAAAAPSVTPR